MHLRARNGSARAQLGCTRALHFACWSPTHSPRGSKRPPTRPQIRSTTLHWRGAMRWSRHAPATHARVRQQYAWRTEVDGCGQQHGRPKLAAPQGRRVRQTARAPESKSSREQGSSHLCARPRKGGGAGGKGRGIHGRLPFVRAGRPLGLEVIAPILVDDVVVDEERRRRPSNHDERVVALVDVQVEAVNGVPPQQRPASMKAHECGFPWKFCGVQRARRMLWRGYFLNSP
jgi:hypothetical protein